MLSEGKFLLILAVFSLGFGFQTTSCKTGSNADGGTPPSVGTVLVDCAKEAVVKTESQIIPSVELALVSADPIAALLGLVASFGNDAVSCVVDHIINRSVINLKAAPSDENTKKKIANGQAFLSRQRVTFVKHD